MSTDSNDEIKPHIGAMQQYTDYKKRRELWGQALIKDRKTLGMNQTQFAEALSKSDYLKDISQQAVARWEAGATPRKETYDGLCKFLKGTFGHLEMSSETLAINLALTIDEMPKFSNVSDPRSTELQYNKLAVQVFMEQLQEDTGLKYLVTEALTTEYSSEAFETWWTNSSPERINRWCKNAMELSDPIQSALNETQRRALVGAPKTQGQVFEIALTALLPESLKKNINVLVSRGINERNYDYFSNKVVAEFKYLPEHRSPSFAISQYAPEIVALKLSETLAFNQKKVYVLFLVHPNASPHVDFNPRFHSLVADCAALGIHVIMVNHTNAAVSHLMYFEDANKSET
jgi:hypothetical protein